jgi:GNAT superfamily N-acetyltransferase
MLTSGYTMTTTLTVRPAVPAARPPAHVVRPNLAATVRPVRGADAAALFAFYDRLSPDTRHSRFLGFARVTRNQAERMVNADGIARCGLVAADPVTGEIVGHLCLEPTERAGLEIGIAVADAWQGHGLGRRLLAEGFVWARQRGVPELYGVALSDNVRILRLASSLGVPCTVRSFGDGLVLATISVAPPDARRQRL